MAEGKTLQQFGINRFRSNVQSIGRKTSAALVLSILTTACEQPVAPIDIETAIAEGTTQGLMRNETSDGGCGDDGQLAVELYGSFRASITWRAEALSCAGMPRPDSDGARIRMSGRLGEGDDTRTLAFIFGIPDLKVGQSGVELPTNVTLIEEGAGRFFSTVDTNGCWTDVTSQEPLGEDNDRAYRIDGTVYCVTPLAELNGGTSVTFTELKFTGRVDWRQPE
ncbi:MAG: hypothetical protein O3A13_11605 [Proteobacteria bacterium]|nr:hypothetical protein [Pseudomonadota bacterium]MDA0994257.1 hypothetical protein [Pseudomonadota bacterium]